MPKVSDCLFMLNLFPKLSPGFDGTLDSKPDGIYISNFNSMEPENKTIIINVLA